MKDHEYTIRPVAYIRTDFKEKFGIPRQSGRAPSNLGYIVFEPEFQSADALREIEGFSHLWLIFGFSLARGRGWTPTVRPPRLGGNRRVGVFASRSPFRPNSLGLSSVRLERIEESKDKGRILVVSGADLLDMTPIYDIKPYLPFTDSHPEALGGYAGEHTEHRLEVIFPESLLLLVPEDKLAALTECLAEDPRPSYQDDADRLYGMRFADLNVRFTVSNGILTVTSVETVSEQQG